MPGTVIKFIILLLIAGLWGLTTYLAGRSALRVWRISEVDTTVTLRLVGKVVFGWVPNPFEGLEKRVKARSDLRVVLMAMDGFTFRPQGGEAINEDFLRDRRQYLLTFKNPGKDPFLDIRLRLQFPYPIERSEIQNIKRVEGIRFSPIGLDITVGGGAARVVQPPLTRVYEFQATQLRSEGRLDLLLLLNSWRDPRGKIIPPEEAPRYVVPELGPSITYIDGSYRVKIGEEEITKSFYAPIGLREDKTVILGPPGPRPDELSQEFGFQ